VDHGKPGRGKYNKKEKENKKKKRRYKRIERVRKENPKYFVEEMKTKWKMYILWIRP